MSKIKISKMDQERLQHKAYKQGLADADTQAVLNSHEERLNTINGSIRRSATANEKLSENIIELKENTSKRLYAIENRSKSADETQDAIATLLQTQQKNRLSKREFYIASAMLAVVLMGSAFTFCSVIIATLVLLFGTHVI